MSISGTASAADRTGPFWGKYMGSCVNNDDPIQIGRILVDCPDVGGVSPTTWAMPAVPVAGPSMGMYALPPVGAGVWVEFQNGDPEYPIWSGCWWGSATETPSQALATPSTNAHIVLQTPSGYTLTISEAPGGQAIRLIAGQASITVDPSGITIDNGQGARIALTGRSVDVNDGALTVT